DSGFELTGFSYADYAGCKDTFKSTSGGAQFLGEKLGKAVVKHLELVEEPIDNRWVVKEHGKDGTMVEGWRTTTTDTNPSGALKSLHDLAALNIPAALSSISIQQHHFFLAALRSLPAAVNI
nr:uncharacterized mitochondrial protein AtMg00810-like [Tanacetum cinerariifolium]